LAELDKAFAVGGKRFVKKTNTSRKPTEVPIIPEKPPLLAGRSEETMN